VSVQKTLIPSSPGMPVAPAIALEILQWLDINNDLKKAVEKSETKFPQFFKRLLTIINSDHYPTTTKVYSVYQAISESCLEGIVHLALIQIIYRTFNQYRINGINMQAFWQDSLRRAVSAKMMGEIIGLDTGICFSSGFIQDIGYLVLFLEQSEKGLLWSEFRKREPKARLSMEEATFNSRHDYQLARFLKEWNVFSGINQPLVSHHNFKYSDTSYLSFSNFNQQLCKVLHCADWMAAVYTADDKSFVLNQCRTIFKNDLQIEVYKIEDLLETIPDEVEMSALILGVHIDDSEAFSKVLYEENIQLNQHNENFQELSSRLEKALEERDKLAEELNRDLTLAREIQKSLLPTRKPGDYPVHGINVSAKILSGDFYDFFELENTDIYFNLGDVSGKGVNAALLMAKTISLFRCLGKRIHDPGKLLYEINNELCETSIHGMFVTMVAGLYSQSTGELRLVNAGNSPALLQLDSGICQEFEATAPPLGILSDTVYKEYDINLNNGSLYVYSDGVTEGYVDDESVLGVTGLFKLISSLDRKMTPCERLNKIVNVITNTTQTLRDDVTMILLEKSS